MMIFYLIVTGSTSFHLVAAGWPRSREGRKLLSSSALYARDGGVLAVANATWVELNDPSFIEKLKADRS